RRRASARLDRILSRERRELAPFLPSCCRAPRFPAPPAGEGDRRRAVAPAGRATPSLGGRQQRLVASGAQEDGGSPHQLTKHCSFRSPARLRFCTPRPILPAPHSQGGMMLRRFAVLSALALLIGSLSAGWPAQASRRSIPGVDVRLTNDDPSLSGYVSAYTLGTGNAYTDSTLDECSVSRGRQNEPAAEVDPRNQSVLIGSSNDYCGVYSPPGDPTTGSALGPVW